jgi:integrase
MPNAKFVLKEPTSKEPTLLYLFFYFNGQQLKYSTGQKINPKYWNSKTRTAKELRQFPEYAEFNTLLKNLSNCVSNEYRRLINDGISPSPDKLKAALNEFLKKNEKKNEKDFLGFIEEIIKTSGKKTSTVQQYKLTRNRLQDFIAFTKRKLEFDDIDLTFYEAFTNYLSVEKKYGINTVGNTIKNIKVFMNEALERGLTTNAQFKSKKFKKVQEASENIYLTTSEIETIYNLDLTNNPRLANVRDLFIIGCYTGLRFSDLVQLKEENLIDNKTKVKIKTTKTGEVVIIPLHRYIKEILAKNEGALPPLISNQKMNDYLKELGEKAEIESHVLITSTKAGNKLHESFKKFQLITTHTARRSFATNAYLNEVPTLSIMKITGHKTEKAFLTYIKMSQEDNANKLLNHAFFN